MLEMKPSNPVPLLAEPIVHARPGSRDFGTIGDFGNADLPKGSPFRPVTLPDLGHDHTGAILRLRASERLSELSQVAGLVRDGT